MKFFELLQIVIGNRKMFSHTPTDEEWRELFALSQKQAMVGIAFRGVEQLPAEQRPPKQLFMQWYMATERIKALNADLNRKALAVANRFLEEGFPSLVLKGQGISKLYILRDNVNENINQSSGREKLTSASTLGVCRTPGDIDIWLHGSREEVLDYVRRHVPDCKPVYHHVDFPVVDGLDIEVHFTPSWMNSPVTNHRLQRFFRESADALFARNEDGEFSILNSQTVPLFIEGRAEQSEAEGVTSVARRQSYSEIPSPPLAFNRVYILVHIYRHLFHEGIGLRQLMDYYFVLHQGFTEEERAETMHTLSSLKMERFAAAVMWVLQEVYGMDGRYLLTTPDEREGRFLLNEIMLAGNFGHYDKRIKRVTNESALHTFVRRVARNFRFVRSYPSEVLWSPLFKLWHYFWRKII